MVVCTLPVQAPTSRFGTSVTAMELEAPRAALNVAAGMLVVQVLETHCGVAGTTVATAKPLRRTSKVSMDQSKSPLRLNSSDTGLLAAGADGTVYAALAQYMNGARFAEVWLNSVVPLVG